MSYSLRPRAVYGSRYVCDLRVAKMIGQMKRCEAFERSRGQRFAISSVRLFGRYPKPSIEDITAKEFVPAVGSTSTFGTCVRRSVIILSLSCDGYVPEVNFRADDQMDRTAVLAKGYSHVARYIVSNPMTS